MTRNSPGSRPAGTDAAGVVGIIVGHGDLPAALRAAAISIVNEPDVLEAVSNVSRRAEGLDAKIDEAAARHPGKAVLLFVDLYGSSCAHGGIKFRARHPGTAVLCGVNLPMLVRFLHYRHRLGYDELVEFLRRTGSEEIRPAGI
jgi:mannose/fructose-specific phosphotransferase system component IIA